MKLPFTNRSSGFNEPPIGSSAIDGKDLLSLVIELSKDTWRLKRSISRHGKGDADLYDELSANIQRLIDNLGASQVEVYDMDGQSHHPGDRCQIAHVQEGEGDLFVSETLIPGVKILGNVVSTPTVILSHREG